MDFGIAFDGDGDRIGMMIKVEFFQEINLTFVCERNIKRRGAKIIGDVKLVSCLTR